MKRIILLLLFCFVITASSKGKREILDFKGELTVSTWKAHGKVVLCFKNEKGEIFDHVIKRISEEDQKLYLSKIGSKVEISCKYFIHTKNVRKITEVVSLKLKKEK